MDKAQQDKTYWEQDCDNKRREIEDLNRQYDQSLKDEETKERQDQLRYPDEIETRRVESENNQ